MPIRDVDLTEYHEQVIDRLVESGRYQNASEVMREGLRLVEQRENLEAAKLAALRDAAQQGFADLDQGRFIDLPAEGLEELLAELGLEAEAKRQKAGS
ncbi:type II toxin-antitoxin system ParD family antitoxin [Rhizobium sp. 18065]|uniref:type II toxin-antitoxin system ParD family antitoxin n=1 Tax=Rhizobium sp. 18065 TaxID=2681411 RepID=UPI00135B91EE|nr:type II toxin-antitoxin system ParD family antitoxin [Rhizobium sp. 18065]